MGLTDEQRRRMEENRKKALERRNQQQKPGFGSNASSGNAVNNNSFKPNLNSSGQSSFTSSVQPKTSNFYGGSSGSNSGTKPGFSGTSSGFNSGGSNSGIKPTNSWSSFNSGQKSGNSNSFGNNKSSGFKPDLKWNPGHWNPGNKSNSAHNNDYSHNMNLKPDGKTNLFDKNDTQKKAVFGKTVNGHFRLLSKERFIVEMGFHQGAIDVFKTMESKVYDATTRKWNFLLSDHDNLVKALLPMKPEVTVAPLPLSVRKVLQDASQYPPLGSIDISSLDPKLLDSLMPFQHDGVCFGVSRRGRCLIADDMGLGKTIQALGIASYYKHLWPLLIVSPSSVRFNWKNSVVRWLSSVNEYDVVVVSTGKDEFKNAQVVVISYDLLNKKKKEIEAFRFNAAIFDESHYMKNYKSARYKAAQPIMQRVKCLVLLSGTPALSRPIELFTQISAIDRKIFPNLNDYGIRYCDGKQLQWGWDFNGFSNLEEMQIILESRVMIRRLKKDVLKQLPPKQRMTVILDPSAVESSTKAMKEAAQIMGIKTLGGSEKHSAMLQYFSETAYAKIKAVGEYMKELLESDKKFIIFAHHQVMLNKLVRVCEDQKVQYMKIDGSTKSADRQTNVDRFQNSEAVRVAVLSITAANAGITLTAAQLVVFSELFWNPGILIQAEDRAHRIGQEDSVLVQYLVAQNTADDHIWNMIQAKLEVLSKAGLTKDNFTEADTARQKDRNQSEMTDYYSEDGDKDKGAADKSLADAIDDDSLADAIDDDSLADAFSDDFPLDNLLPDEDGQPPSKKRKPDSLFDSF